MSGINLVETKCTHLVCKCQKTAIHLIYMVGSDFALKCNHCGAEIQVRGRK